MPDYNSDAGLLEHLQIQKQNIAQFKGAAGADDEDIESVMHDHDNMQAILAFCPLADEYKSNAFGIKRALIRGEPGAAVGGLMTAPVFVPPFALVAGIEKRTRERDQRFKRSKTMTEAALLGLDLSGESSSGAVETDFKPSLEAFAAQNGYEAGIIVSNRGRSDMWKVLGRKMNTEKWTELLSGTGKSGNLEIAPATEGQPERMELKLQLYKSNEPYGQASDPVYVTFNP